MTGVRGFFSKVWKPRAGHNHVVARALIILIVGAALYPAIMSALFWPTPSQDLREHINWGLHFPLHTWKLPPLQSWLAGTVALTGARDAWLYFVLAQGFNLLALFYLCRIGREFLALKTTVPLAVAYVLSFYFWFIFESGLNADQIQAPLWLGLLYHLLRAARDDRWSDWLAVALFAALSILAKYFLLLFAGALGLALLLTPSYRPLFLRPKLYVSAALAVLFVLPHAVAMQAAPDVLAYGAERFAFARSLGGRLTTFAELLVTALYGAPFLLTFVSRRHITVQRPAQGAASLIVLTTALLVTVLAVLIGFGFIYRYRYGAPVFPLLLLAAASVVRIEAAANGRLARRALMIGGLAVVGTIAWGFAGPPNRLREPANVAAHFLEAEWRRSYSCGPAYVIGQQLSAHAIAPYFRANVTGLSPGDFSYAQWFKRDVLAREGAILVADPGSGSSGLFATLPPATPVRSLTLPFRRSWDGSEQTYLYRFIPPAGC